MIEWELLLVQMRTASVVLRLAIKQRVLTLLVMFPLSEMLLVLTVIQQMVVLVKFPGVAELRYD